MVGLVGKNHIKESRKKKERKKKYAGEYN